MGRLRVLKIPTMLCARTNFKNPCGEWLNRRSTHSNVSMWWRRRCVDKYVTLLHLLSPKMCSVKVKQVRNQIDIVRYLFSVQFMLKPLERVAHLLACSILLRFPKPWLGSILALFLKEVTWKYATTKPAPSRLRNGPCVVSTSDRVPHGTLTHLQGIDVSPSLLRQLT